MKRERRLELIEKYAAGFDEVRAALNSFTPPMLIARPLTGKWTAAEIVHHLADSEMTSALRLRKLLTEPFAVIAGYDQEIYAERLGYNNRDISVALDAFRAARATTLQILENMSDSDWRRTGWHSESGSYGVDKWLEIYAAHAHDHAAQIRLLRHALRSER